MSLCEIRVPTYRRPKLLKRALNSILTQTYSDWRCIVLDDCRNASAQPVVDKMHDSRIIYSQNQRRLGAIGNIDGAFARGPLYGGAYAFVLEDDNYLMPTHIEQSVELLNQSDAKISLCNQYCETAETIDEPGRLTDHKTLNWMYEPGLHDPEDLLPALLFSHGFSNGAAFWRTDCLSNLQIGGWTTRPSIQESLRLLRLRDPVYVSLDATSVWRARDPQNSFAQRRLSVDSIRRFALDGLDKVLVEIEMINYQSHVVKRLGPAKLQTFITGNSIPDFANFRDDRIRSIERAMLINGYDGKIAVTRSFDRLRWRALGYILRHLILPHWMPQHSGNFA
jgi:glycosyltransferase involved in cell wall biosynthesis